jgi:hypothetical protein
VSGPDKKLPGKSSSAEVAAFLDQVAKAPVVKAARGRGRLIFAMDATASREPTWDQACHIQGQMFEATAALGGLDIQLCYYRGQGEFSAAPWLNRAADLQSRMTSVFCRGGITQIQRLLQHALKETRVQKVNALVFVGDCIEEPVDRIVKLAGELGMRAVPLFVFQEGNEPIAERTFREMARLTQGAYCAFDAGSARQLADLLSAVAVYAAGGRHALEDFGRQRGGAVAGLLQQMARE